MGVKNSKKTGTSGLIDPAKSGSLLPASTSVANLAYRPHAPESPAKVDSSSQVTPTGSRMTTRSHSSRSSLVTDDQQSVVNGQDDDQNGYDEEVSLASVHRNGSSGSRAGRSECRRTRSRGRRDPSLEY